MDVGELTLSYNVHDAQCLQRVWVMAGKVANGRLNDKAAMEGMGLNPREVMDLAISAMSAMTFSWGFVHCDPHPGNILVRKHPTKRGKPQIVNRLVEPTGSS